MNNKEKNTPQPPALSSASLFKKLAALVYDGFILFSLVLLATALALIANGGESFINVRYLFLGYLFLVLGFFLSWFWQKSGQTLGMLSWHIKVIQTDGQPLSWRRAWLRYITAYFSYGFCGIGILWSLFDKDRQYLHDRLCGTQIVKKSA